MSKKKPLARSSHNVMGLVHPFRPEYRVQGNVPIGTTVYTAIREACKSSGIRRGLLNYGVAQIGKRDYEKEVTRWTFLPFSKWKKHKLAPDEILRFRILPKGGGGGGGGGKNAMNTVLSVVVAVAAIAATVFTAGTLAPAMGFAAGGAMATFMGGLAGMAVLTIGQALVNAIAPVAAPSLSADFGSGSSAKEDSVYSISAGRNTVDQWGRVPVPVGHGRYAPPKAAAPYTSNEGEDQFLHELLCIGIGDIQVSSIKIGTTPIEQYTSAEWEIFRTDIQKVSRYFPTGIYEETFSIELNQYETVSRATQECDYAIIDIAFNGLCVIDDWGNNRVHSVSFDVSYSKIDSVYSVDNHTSVGQHNFHHGVNLYKPPSTGSGVVVISYEAGIIIRWGGDASNVYAGEYGLGILTYSQEGDWNKLEFERLPENDDAFLSIDGFQVNAYSGFSKNVWGLSIASGYAIQTATKGRAVRSSFTVEGAQTTLLRRGFTIRFPRRGIYLVSVTRITEIVDDNRWRDESTWTTLRSCTNDQPVNTSYPVTLLALQIKASGQLSGAIDTLTVYYETKCRDWNGSTWVWRYTSNSAAIMMYILMQEHCWSFPQYFRTVDEQSFIKAYEFCQQRNFEFNKVYDSSESLYDRLVSVGASCLSSPTILEGKWSIITDSPRDNVICAFTCANSWNWSFERTQIKLPNAIHCNFVNENTWESDMRVVTTDEEQTADYIYESQTYDGVTNPDQIWLLARFHYADAKRRRRTISFTAYDESILCTRGDLVELCCPNVGVQGLQVGRVRKVTRNALGYVTRFTTDQLNQTDNSGRVFGVKIYAATGNIWHSPVKAENKAQRLITLQSPMKMDIADGDKYVLGDFNEEVFQAIVLSMKFNADWTCEITCQDYDEYIYGDLSGPIPDFESVITTPIELRWTISSIPIITGLITDERVLVIGSNGTLLCRILVYLADPPNLDPLAQYYNIQVREVLDDSAGIYSPWRNAVRGVSIDQDQAFVNDVNEGAVYELRARYTGHSGEYGPWCTPVRTTVDGSLAPPPDVTNFKVTITNPEGIWLTWDNIPLKDIAYYRIWGAALINAVASPYLYKPWRQTGLLEFWIVAVDRGGRESLHPAYDSCEVFPPKNVVVDTAELLEEGVVASWQDAFTTWDLSYYAVRVREYEHRYSPEYLECIIPWTGRFYKNEPFWIRARDIFENYSVNSTNRIITIYPPLTPKIELGFDITNGNVTIDWQDCKNPTKENTPSIDYYEITGTLAMGKPVQVKGLHYESIVPLIVYEFGAGTVEGGIPVNVGNIHIKVIAVDKYGITSEDADDYEDNSVDLELLPPYNPTDFGVSAVVEGDSLEAKWTESTAIMLTWRDCQRTLAISHYIVYDSLTDTEYRVATNYIILPVRPHGTYPINVQAFDVLGLSSANMTYFLSIGGVGGMEVTGKIDGSDIYLEWTTPDSSFKIDHYIIMQDNDELPSGTNSDKTLEGYLGEAKTNFYRLPAGAVGSYTFYVWAVDMAGNINTDFANYATVVIEPNGPPLVQAAVEGIGVGLSWTRTNKENTLPVAQWEVRRYLHLDEAEQVALNTPVQDYGLLDVTKTTVDAFIRSDYTFVVRALDTGGNYGEWGLCDFNVQLPGKVTFTNTLVIDNNIQLYWTEPDRIFFAIKEYIFAEYDEYTGIHMEIGRIDAHFTSESEQDGGVYSYSITPLDWGGNRGEPAIIRMELNQPPGLQYIDKYDSLYNGEKINLIMDGQGHLIGPYLPAETWIENRERISQLQGKEIITHQEKVDAGYIHWPDPGLTYGKYVEAIDHGAHIGNNDIIEGCTYSVFVDYDALTGDPIITCKIELSVDGKEWRLAENDFKAYATNFRYSRITLEVTGGTVRINSIRIDLKIRKLQDYGRVYCDKDDNGFGWISEALTPMLTGTWVPFNVQFIDVQSIPKPNVINNENYTAYTIFEDEFKPEGFRIFVKDKEGNRVSADVDWTAHGV